ncbi:MAG: hypothetical protein ACLGIP_19750 [Alphaproteobacteria bacterium]
MSREFKSFECQSGFSSPPCYAAEIAPDYYHPMAVDCPSSNDLAQAA